MRGVLSAGRFVWMIGKGGYTPMGKTQHSPTCSGLARKIEKLTMPSPDPLPRLRELDPAACIPPCNQARHFHHHRERDRLWPSMLAVLEAVEEVLDARGGDELVTAVNNLGVKHAALARTVEGVTGE